MSCIKPNNNHRKYWFNNPRSQIVGHGYKRALCTKPDQIITSENMRTRETLELRCVRNALKSVLWLSGFYLTRTASQPTMESGLRWLNCESVRELGDLMRRKYLQSLQVLWFMRNGNIFHVIYRNAAICKQCIDRTSWIL